MFELEYHGVDEVTVPLSDIERDNCISATSIRGPSQTPVVQIIRHSGSVPSASLPAVQIVGAPWSKIVNEPDAAVTLGRDSGYPLTIRQCPRL